MARMERGWRGDGKGGRLYLESLVEVVDEANPLSCLLGEASGLGLKGLGLLFKLPLIREYFYYSSYGDMSTSFLSLLPLPSFSLVPLMHICTPTTLLKRREKRREKRKKRKRWWDGEIPFTASIRLFVTLVTDATATLLILSACYILIFCCSIYGSVI